MYATNLLSRFMQCPTQVHYEAADEYSSTCKEQKTTAYGTSLLLVQDCLDTHCDLVGSVDDTRSTFGYAFTLGFEFSLGHLRSNNSRIIISKDRIYCSNTNYKSSIMA